MKGYTLYEHVRYMEKPTHMRPPARNKEECLANIRSYKITLFGLEQDLKSKRFFGKGTLKYQIKEYQKLLEQEEYKYELKYGGKQYVDFE